jgi:hypothetical protein
MSPRFITSYAFGIVVLLLSSLSCAPSKEAADPPSGTFPVILFVASENGGFVNPVHIKATIDSKIPLVDQDFSAGLEAGHPEFKVNLSKGRHQLEAESVNGDAGLDVIFMVDKPMWLYLSYWGKNHFQLNISYQQFLFM